MKVILKAHNILLAVIVFVSAKATAAGDPLVELKKTYSKSYSLNSNEKVSFYHQYGDLKIYTWDKNEVKTDVTISVSSEDEEYARSVLNAISIEDGRNTGGVFYRTVIGDPDKRRSRKARNENRTISYVVYLPAVAPLYVNMQFGSTLIADYKGPVEIAHEYGSLSAGNLSNVKSITATYGSSVIKSISNGRVSLEYGDAKIESVSGTVLLKSGYGQLRVGLDNDLKSLDLNAEYGDVQIKAADNINASFNIRTSYGELKSKGGIKFSEDKRSDDRGPNFDHTYNATNGNGAAKVKVKSEFTQVTVTNASFEEKGKDKKKEKSI